MTGYRKAVVATLFSPRPLHTFGYAASACYRRKGACRSTVTVRGRLFYSYRTVQSRDMAVSHDSCSKAMAGTSFLCGHFTFWMLHQFGRLRSLATMGRWPHAIIAVSIGPAPSCRNRRPAQSILPTAQLISATVGQGHNHNPLSQKNSPRTQPPLSPRSSGPHRAGHFPLAFAILISCWRLRS